MGHQELGRVGGKGRLVDGYKITDRGMNSGILLQTRVIVVNIILYISK